MPSSDPGDPRYERGYGDFAFIAYNVIFFSFVRQVITVNVSRRVGRYFGITREGKLDRFGEQGYAFVYFLFFGAWGLVSALLPPKKNILLTSLEANYVATPDVVVPNREFLDR